MKKRISILFVLVSFALLGQAQTNHCIKNRYAQDTFFNINQIDTLKNIKYGSSNIWPGNGTMDLHLDVYMPATSIDPLKERPLIVLIHGGSFLHGDKKDMEYYGKAYAQRGFVAVSIQYQLGWNCPSTNVLSICVQCGTKSADLIKATYRAMQDTRGALKYLVQNSGLYGIDTSAIFLMGESAGSITALHTAFLSQSEADSICKNCKPVLGGIDTVNSTLSNQFDIKGVIDNCGAVNKLNPIDNNNIPTIGFHDDLDCLVPYGSGRLLNCLGCTAFNYASGSNSIHNRLKSNGTCSQMNTITGSLNHCSYPKAAIVGKSSCFMKDLFCFQCTSSATSTIWNIPSCDSGYVLTTPKLLRNQVSIFPNPAHQQFVIKTGGKTSISICDIHGKLIQRININSNSTTLNCSTWSKGMYYIIAENNAIHKLIIE